MSGYPVACLTQKHFWQFLLAQLIQEFVKLIDYISKLIYSLTISAMSILHASHIHHHTPLTPVPSITFSQHISTPYYCVLFIFWFCFVTPGFNQGLLKWFSHLQHPSVANSSSKSSRSHLSIIECWWAQSYAGGHSFCEFITRRKCITTFISVMQLLHSICPLL